MSNIVRPPVVAVMGHIDHGKSTLLDYIRKTNITAKEAGGITQRMSAYKVERADPTGKKHFITFLDTPGHEAFGALRSRGAKVADIAILVVATDEGVKPQTIEALKAIKNAGLPFIVAMNKIDRPNSDIEKTKQNLAENEVFVEGYGGDVPAVPVSAITGKGVDELLDMVLLLAELQDLKARTDINAEGIIIEAQNEKTRGISATLIIKNGVLKSGMCIVSEESIAPTRIMEDFQGKKITEAMPSDPIRIVGFDSVPPVGSIFTSYKNKKEAETSVQNFKENKQNQKSDDSINEEALLVTIPLIIKASTTDVIEAIMHEIKKIKNERVGIKIVQSGIGYISESDVKLAITKEGSLIVGFETKTDASAKALADRNNINIESFNIIYKLTEWLEKIMTERTPKLKTEEIKGRAKILRFFSRTKDRQVIGARVEEGSISSGDEIKVIRRDVEIARGKIKDLQQSKVETKEVKMGLECGAMIECKFDLAPGDKIESFRIVER